MKFTMLVNYKDPKEGEEPWLEYYDQPDIETQEQADLYGQEIIKNFNASHLYPGERDRVFMSVVITGPSDPVPCEHCKGKGMEEPDCPECEGKGWVDDPDDGGTMLCSTCEGEECSQCHGEKYV